MTILAIIPARSGSKGVKNKNIRQLYGKPLLAYSIEAAIKSGIFNEIMVSTDSEEYAAIAREYGAKVPFLRSQITSSDQASTWETVREVLANYRGLGKEFDAFCLLQPTSPLRTADDIEKAYKLFKNAGVAVVSVCETEDSPNLCNILPSDGSLAGFSKALNGFRRQDREVYYRVNGAIYIVDVDEFERNDFLYREGSYAYIMDRASSLDIDDEYDFLMAEFIMKNHSCGCGET